MAETMMLPPDKGSPHRKAITLWDDLWHGRYLYDQNRTETVDAAPGYSRSFSRLVSGLFQRQAPNYTNPDTTNAPLTQNQLAALLAEIVAKGAGYGHVLVRPVSDGAGWQPSVVAPTQFHVTWAHRTPQHVVVWDYARDPRKPEDDRSGLAITETWTPGRDQPGRVVTKVYETTSGAKGTELGREIDTANPPEKLADHPFVVSAQNDQIPRDVQVFVWAWEDIGPVSLWYTNEGVINGLARLWDQEQDDAEMTRRRIAMPEDMIGKANVMADDGTTVIARPGFHKHDNLLMVGSSMSAEHGPNGGVTPIEFDDDLIQRERIEGRENALLESVGINPASIGRNVAGRSDSGVAKRADNQMTMNTITEPARAAEVTLSAAVTEAARLGTGTVTTTQWDVTVSEGLKENPVESAETARALRDADAASTRTLIATAHPTWSDTEVDAELALMEAEGAAVAPLEL